MVVVDFSVLPERTALVNIDIQNCFVETAEDGLFTLDRINWLAQVCRDAGIVVIHTRHVLHPDGTNMGRLGDLVPSIRHGLLNRGAITAELHPVLVVDPRDVLLEKPRFGAFPVWARLFPVWARLSRSLSRLRRLVGRFTTAKGRPAFPRSATIDMSSVTTMLVG